MEKEHRGIGRSEVRIVIDVTDGLRELLLSLCPPSNFGHELKKIQEKLNKIMATQAELDAQVQAANDKLDALGTAIQAEADQIAAFIASQPAGLDTSALDGVVARLGAAADSVSSIFTPPAAT